MAVLEKEIGVAGIRGRVWGVLLASAEEVTARERHGEDLDVGDGVAAAMGKREEDNN